MRLLFDQNISHRILKQLPDVYAISSVTVKSLGLINVSDREIWDFAKNNSYTIVTQDSDFNDLTSLYGFPPKIVWIRTGNLKTQEITDIILQYVDEIQAFIKDENYGCFEIYKLAKL